MFPTALLKSGDARAADVARGIQSAWRIRIASRSALALEVSVLGSLRRDKWFIYEFLGRSLRFVDNRIRLLPWNGRASSLAVNGRVLGVRNDMYGIQTLYAAVLGTRVPTFSAPAHDIMAARTGL